jgi:hypothetical protein
MKTDLLRLFLHYLRAIPTWFILTFHNTWGILNVFFIVWVRPMRGGIIGLDHPFATGINPQSGNKIWKDNLVFKSPRKRHFDQSDEEILEAVGEHMAGMFSKSCSSEKNPFGIPDRMPPAINYIHGGVHYNGGFLLFDDVQDAVAYFSNLSFQKDFVRFILSEKREPVTILRDRNYEREDLLRFVCFLRSLFPWFSNSNGNRKRIGWGNPAPYPSINTITGFWKNDTYKFYSSESAYTAPRVPIVQSYFKASEFYKPATYEFRKPERFLADFTNQRVLARGEKGNLFFVDLRQIKHGYKFDGGNLPNIFNRLGERISRKINMVNDL